MDKEFAEHFAADWIASWNAHDLEQILSHYADNFEMSSPVIIQVAGEPSGTLRGKAAVGAYWKKHWVSSQTSNLNFFQFLLASIPLPSTTKALGAALLPRFFTSAQTIGSFGPLHTMPSSRQPGSVAPYEPSKPNPSFHRTCAKSRAGR